MGEGIEYFKDVLEAGEAKPIFENLKEFEEGIKELEEKYGAEIVKKSVKDHKNLKEEVYEVQYRVKTPQGEEIEVKEARYLNNPATGYVEINQRGKGELLFPLDSFLTLANLIEASRKVVTVGGKDYMIKSPKRFAEALYGKVLEENRVF